MTLEQTFPGLREGPGGSMLALADNVFDLTGPGHALTTDLSLEYRKRASFTKMPPLARTSASFPKSVTRRSCPECRIGHADGLPPCNHSVIAT